MRRVHAFERRLAVRRRRCRDREALRTTDGDLAVAEGTPLRVHDRDHRQGRRTESDHDVRVTRLHAHGVMGRELRRQLHAEFIGVGAKLNHVERAVRLRAYPGVGIARCHRQEMTLEVGIGADVHPRHTLAALVDDAASYMPFGRKQDFDLPARLREVVRGQEGRTERQATAFIVPRCEDLDVEFTRHVRVARHGERPAHASAESRVLERAVGEAAVLPVGNATDGLARGAAHQEGPRGALHGRPRHVFDVQAALQLEPQVVACSRRRRQLPSTRGSRIGPRPRSRRFPVGEG